MRVASRRIPLTCICAAISAALLLVCTKSSPLYPLNDWVDTNIYFTIGKGLMRGYVPYLDLYDQKGPTVYLLYGLASLVSGKSFLGVYLLETLSFAAFLMISYRLVRLFTEREALWTLPLLSLAVLTSVAFSHGGSLEEFCLPIFAYGLYSALRYYRCGYPAPVRLTVPLINGLLAGLLLTSKFTLLAFYLAWMAMLFFSQCRLRRVGHGLNCCAVFLAGMLLPLGLWSAYFAAHDALPAFCYYYFTSNVTSYASLSSPTLPAVLAAIVKSAGAAFLKNPAFMLPAALGVLWTTFSKKAALPTPAKLTIWSTAMLLACGMYMGGQSYRYYAMVFAAFAPLGLPPLLLLTERIPLPQRFSALRRFLVAAVTAVCVGLSLLFSGNVYLLGKPKNETPQYRFAALMRARQSDATLTLLCRAFPDSGFYLAADVIPDCRFFTSNNVAIPDVAEEQVRRVEAGIPEFVVMRDRSDPPSSRYELVETASLPYEQYVCTYYLYERRALDGADTTQ